MNLIQALNKQRQEIQSWVTLNIRNILSKINQHTSDSSVHITDEDRTKLDCFNDGLLIVDSINVTGKLTVDDNGIQVNEHIKNSRTGEQMYADFVDIPLNTEVAVGEKFNGKQVYTYTWCAGAVPYADPTTEKTLEVPVVIDRLVRFNAWAERRIDSTSRQFAYSIPYVRGNDSGFTEYVFVTLYRDNNGNWKLHVAHKSTPDNGDYLFCQVWYTKE